MLLHADSSPARVRSEIRKGVIRFGGNRRLKIYGELHCASGKKMLRGNRVFFASEAEAIEEGYRPCGHCLSIKYKQWKMKTDKSEQTLKNLLPADGIVIYYGRIFGEEADILFKKLFNNIDWRNDEAIMFGRKIITKRKVAWYGDKPFEYSYSKTTKKALPWTRELIELKQVIERISGESYNSCLLNLYHNGSEGMAWHCDEERELKKNGAIASLSLGAERKFLMKHKQSGEKVEQVLEHGSLLVMKGTTQSHWLHRLPTTKRITTPRINLTFRTIV